MGSKSAPIGHYDRSILHRLVNRIVAMTLVSMWPLSQNHKLLLEISVDERKQGNGREKYVRHQRVDDFREALGDAVSSWVCLVRVEYT